MNKRFWLLLALLSVGVGAACASSSAVHESPWWLVGTFAGSCMAGVAWGTK